ncbi:MAG: alcohol dehydrogenase catalytic domain-containing protein [Planctomycetota bacterium]
MRAICLKSGEPVLCDQPKSQPVKGEVLIKVHLAGVCGTDLALLRGHGEFEGILGHEFVGAVVAGSSNLVGKRVVGEINCVCGRCDMCGSGLSNHCRRRTVIGIANRPGAFAEFLALPERNCHVVPDAVTDEEAVFTEPLAAAFQITRQVKLESKMNVALLGTGRLGLLVAQVLALSGCRLIAIGRNPVTLNLLDRKRIRTLSLDDLTPSRDQDLVIDCTGSPDGLPTALKLARPRGTVVMKTTCSGDAPIDWTPLVVDEITLLGSRCGPFGEALAALATKRIEVASLISRRLPLSQGLTALQPATDRQHIKTLLRMTE